MAESLPPVIAVFDGDAEDLDAILDDLEARFEALGEMSANPDVGINDEQFDADYSDVISKLETLDTTDADPNVGLSEADFDAKLGTVEAALADLEAEHIDPSVGLSTADFDAKLGTVEAALFDLDAEEADPKVGLETADFDAKYLTVQASLIDLDAEEADPTVGLNTAPFEAVFLDLQGQLASLNLEGLGQELSGTMQDLENLTLDFDNVAPAAASMAGDVGVSVGATEESLAGLDGAIGTVGGDIANLGTVARLSFADVVAAAEGVGLHFDDIDDAVNQLGFNANETAITTKEAMQSIAIAATNAGQDASLGIEAFYANVENGAAGLSAAAPEIDDIFESLVTGGIDAETAAGYFELAGLDIDETITLITQGLTDAEPVVGGFGADISSMASGASEAFSSIAGFGTLIVGAVLTAIPAIGALLGAVGALAGVLSTAFLGIGAFVLGALGDFSTLETGAKSALTAYQAAVAPFVQPVVNDLIPVIQKGLQALEPVADAAAGAIGSIITELSTDMSSSGFQQFIAFVATSVGPAISSLSQFTGGFVTMWGEMMENGGPAINTIESGISKLGQDMAKFGDSNTFKSFVNWFAQNGPAIGAQFESIAHNVGDLVAAFEPFGDRVLQAFTDFLDLVTPGLAAIAEWLGRTKLTVLDLIAPWMLAWGSIKTGFDDAWSAIQSAFNAALTWVEGVPGDILGALSSLGQDLSNWATTAWGFVTSGFTSAWGATSSWLAGLWGDITGAVGDIASDLSNWATTAWNAVTSAFKSAWSATSSWLAGLWNDITGAAGDIGGDFLNWASTAFGFVESGFKTAWSDVSGWLGDLGADIVQAIGDLSKLLVSVGEDVVEGFLNGLKDAWKDVTGWLGTAAGDVKGIISSVLGVLSPSTVMAEVGGYVMQGFGQGLQQGFDAHVAGVLHSTAQAVASLTSGASVSGSSAIRSSASTGVGATTGAPSLAALPPVSTVSPGSSSSTSTGGLSVSIGDLHFPGGLASVEDQVAAMMPEIQRQILVKARGTVNAYGKYGASRA